MRASSWPLPIVAATILLVASVSSVAAQTEELRVQRAAIARTQRAVRNLARPEDEVGADEPTEPALRDPNQPNS